MVAENPLRMLPPYPPRPPLLRQRSAATRGTLATLENTPNGFFGTKLSEPRPNTARLGATLYARGRDVTETELAVEFDKVTCRWRMLGAADDVRVTAERAKIIEVLRAAE